MVSSRRLRGALAVGLVDGTVILRSVLLTELLGPFPPRHLGAGDDKRHDDGDGNDDHDDQCDVAHSFAIPAATGAQTHP